MTLTKQNTSFLICGVLCFLFSLSLTNETLFSHPKSVFSHRQQKAEEGYKIQPKDVLEIIITPNFGKAWKLEVNEKGKANIPLLGWLEVKDKTTKELTEELIVLYNEYIIDPKTEVRVIKKHT